MAQNSRHSMGRSPRARGSPRAGEAPGPLGGSIPACAGEPRADSRLSAVVAVDPRVRGGAVCPCAGRAVSGGRSPRARGSQNDKNGGHPQEGSIPACAGEPLPRHGLGDRHQVDPRVRGGASPSSQHHWSNSGRSPRARGSLAGRRHKPAPVRSIPACAGEPSVPIADGPCVRVDPRVRGGARCHRGGSCPT